MSLYESGQSEMLFDIIMSLGLDEDKAEKAKSFFQKDSYKQRVWSQSLKTTIPSSETRRYPVSYLQEQAEKAIVECLAEFKDPLPVMNDFIEKMKPIIKGRLADRLASGVFGNGINLPNKTLASRKKMLVSALLKNTPGEFGKNFIHADTWLLAGVYRTVAWDVAQEYHFVRSWLEYSIRQHNERLFLLVRKLHPKTLVKLTPEILEDILIAIVKKGLSDNVSELISKIRDLVPQLKTEAMRKQFLFAFYDWDQEVNPFEPPESHDKLDFLLRLTAESLKIKMPSTRFKILISLKALMKDDSPKVIVKVFQDAYSIKVKAPKGRKRSLKGHFIRYTFMMGLEALRIDKYEVLQDFLSEVFLRHMWGIVDGRSTIRNNLKLTATFSGGWGEQKCSLVFENVKEEF